MGTRNGKVQMAQGRNTTQGADGKGRVERLNLAQSIPLSRRLPLVVSVSSCTVYVTCTYAARVYVRIRMT
jgi:hypothetical protein